jgi:hypothetical protein
MCSVESVSGVCVIDGRLVNGYVLLPKRTRRKASDQATGTMPVSLEAKYRMQGTYVGGPGSAQQTLTKRRVCDNQQPIFTLTFTLTITSTTSFIHPPIPCLVVLPISSGTILFLGTWPEL